MPVLAVGAAFNFHAGLLPQAPTWMQRRGLEWLFRLVAEPTRLWKRYLLLNPYYLALLLAQRSGLRRFRLETKSQPKEEVLYG
jgi:UDP-N-acetyl-D-mannosaminuronic acid transferase (WecB/TagA/CpsF family)